MLTLTGKRYAKDDAEMIESLFTPNVCVGFYKVNAGGVLLLDLQNNVFAYIVNNKHNEQFLVSASRRKEDGLIWYSYGLSCNAAAMIGLDPANPYRDERRIAREALASLHAKDSDCTINPDTLCCTLCGVDHSDECLDCGGRGFHAPTCHVRAA